MMTLVELIEQLTKLPPNARISMDVSQPSNPHVSRIQINIEAPVRVLLAPRLPKSNE